jgi:hypothetical protein
MLLKYREFDKAIIIQNSKIYNKNVDKVTIIKNERKEEVKSKEKSVGAKIESKGAKTLISNKGSENLISCISSMKENKMRIIKLNGNKN